MDNLMENYETYEIVSAIGYLSGVRDNVFQNDNEPMKREIYEKLSKNSDARTIRSLCKLRTALMMNYKAVYNQIIYHVKNLDSISYFSKEDLAQLNETGISIIKPNYKPDQYLIDFNKYIESHIDKCRNLFPIWLKWNYIRELFVIDGNNIAVAIKCEQQKYKQYLDFYPYQVYLNWQPFDSGNILFNDKKFLKLLYNQHDDCFYDYGKVNKTAETVVNNIYGFIGAGEKTVMTVDCENTNPYKLCSVLRSLKEEEAKKISKIILYDDIRTSGAWNVLEKFVSIPVEHELVERVVDFKSLVDITMTAGVCREYFRNDIRSFIIVSSDSDFFGLISTLGDARFLVMIEDENCGENMRTALKKSGTGFCSLDDFSTGDIEGLKIFAMLSELDGLLDSALHLNANELFSDIKQRSRVVLTETEEQNFFEKYIKTLKLVTEKNGDMRIAVKR